MSSHDPTVVVLGAGFSAEAGHPMMASFAAVVSELANNPENQLNPEDRARFKRVLDYKWKAQKVYSYLNLDLDNLEHLFSLLDMEASLTPDGDAPALKDDLVFVLVKTIELTRRPVPQLYEERMVAAKQAKDTGAVRKLRSENPNYIARYIGFVRQLREHDTVLTLNYDTVIEEALLCVGSGPDYAKQRRRGDRQ